MKKSITVLLSALAVTALLFVGCTKESEPKTVESIVSSNDDVATTIQSGADEAGVKIDIKDNTITYSYDISNVDGITEEMLEDEDFLKTIEDSLEMQKDSLANVCLTIEEKTGIEAVNVNVFYTYKDKEVAKASFTSADVASADVAEEETD